MGSRRIITERRSVDSLYFAIINTPPDQPIVGDKPSLGIGYFNVFDLGRFTLIYNVICSLDRNKKSRHR